MNFEPGLQFVHDRVCYRVVSGDRCEGDMVIEFSLDGVRWHRPSIAHSEILISFKFQVEENNYGANGKVKRGRGGWYLLDSIKSACRNGWEAEAKRIREQRQQKESVAIQAQLGLPI